MNTPNNKRKKESQEKIEKVFIQLMQNKEVSNISVTDICKLAKLNRTTFYSNYIDIYDLADKVKNKLKENLMEIYEEEINQKHSTHNFLKLFYHIKENQLFYKTYFKLGFDNNDSIFYYDTDLAKLYFGDKHINYHIEFFKNGLNAIIKLWLKNDCKETPEEINSIIMSEYTDRIR